MMPEPKPHPLPSQGMPCRNQGWVYRDRIPPAQAGLSALEFYTQQYRHSSGAQWQERLAAGQIQRQGQPVAAADPLQTGEILEYHRPPWEEPAVPLNFEVLYEDEDILAIAKPAGLPVLPGGNFLTHTLLHQLQCRYPEHPPVPVHRLGRGTSGLMVLARSPLARATLSQYLRESTATAAQAQANPPLRKTYRALIGASDLPHTFTLTTPIGKIHHPILGYLYGASPTGQPAYSEGKVLRRSATSTLVEVTIRTGRPHQIRIHLAAAGYPLLGDPLYLSGGLPRCPDPDHRGGIPVPSDLGYHLHAYHLVLNHPRTQQPLAWVCPPPPPLLV
jgi:23S rRNA pseudouridine1911/1915/1917 synthase